MGEALTEYRLAEIKARVSSEYYRGTEADTILAFIAEVKRLREEVEIYEGAPDETLGVKGYVDNLYDRICKIFEFEQDGCGDEIRRLLFQILKHARMRGYSRGAHNYAKERRELLAKLDLIREKAAPFVEAIRDMDIEIANKDERRYWFNVKEWLRENEVEDFLAAVGAEALKKGPA